MDPLTQGVVGACVSLASTKAKQLAKIAVLGAIGGMAPDLDVLIRSIEDPLLALEYHRQFSHALLFIPLGALLCSAVLYAALARHWRMTFLQMYWPILLGYATHGLLDACTSYGTLLFWPFNDHRVSFDIVSVIDPLFTLPALIFIVIGVMRSQKMWGFIAVAWGALYLTIGALQNHRAKVIGWDLAEQRGHTPQEVQAKPSFANLVVWKILYEFDGHYYVAAVKPGLTDNEIWAGEKIQKLNLDRDFSWLDPSSQQARDIERFTWFSSGFVAVYPEGSNRIADVRYSLLPHKVNPLWGIELSEDAAHEEHVKYIVTRGDGRAAWARLWEMIR